MIPWISFPILIMSNWSTFKNEKLFEHYLSDNRQISCIGNEQEPHNQYTECQKSACTITKLYLI